MFVHVFVFVMVPLWREWKPIIVFAKASASAISLAFQKYFFLLKITFLGGKYDAEVLIRLPKNWIQWPHWDLWIQFWGLIETAESASAFTLRPRMPMISNDYIEYIGWYESIFVTALTHESGPKGDSLMKKPRVEDLVTLPPKGQTFPLHFWNLSLLNFFYSVFSKLTLVR
jgi:hypothetical protein